MSPTNLDLKKGDHVLVELCDHYGIPCCTRQATVIALTRIAQYLEDDIFVLVRYQEVGGRCHGFGCVPLKQVRKADGDTERK